MTLIEGVRSFLLDQSAISTFVGGSRIYPLRLPQKVDFTNHHGAIVLTRIDDIRGAHLRGPHALTRARLQVDAWAFLFDDAMALGTLCRQRLHGYRGEWTDGASPAHLLRVQAILQEMESDRFEEDIGGGLCRHSSDYFVTYADLGEQVLIS